MGNNLAASGQNFASCEMTECWANIWTKGQHFAGNQVLSKIFTKIFPHKMTQKKSCSKIKILVKILPP